jgi:hypothetical protein
LTTTKVEETAKKAAAAADVFVVDAAVVKTYLSVYSAPVAGEISSCSLSSAVFFYRKSTKKARGYYE